MQEDIFPQERPRTAYANTYRGAAFRLRTQWLWQDFYSGEYSTSVSLFLISDRLLCSAPRFKSTCGCTRARSHIPANIPTVGKLLETRAVLLGIGEHTQENALTSGRNPNAKRHSRDERP